MDKSLIDKAKEIANQQKSDRLFAKEKHIKEIYDETIRLLEDSIRNEKIYHGEVKFVRISHT